VRRNGFGTKPGIKGVCGNGRGKFGGNRQRTRTLYATQHLPESKIECAQTTLAAVAGRRFLIAVVPVVIMRMACACMRVAARMPCGVYERALLRNEQQDYAKIMEKPTRHCLSVARVQFGKITAGLAEDYLATVTTASVSR
jgi:hypothetical protein